MKKITIKMFAPGNRTHKTAILSAGKGRIFKPGHEFNILSRVADQLETEFPCEEFRMVQVGPAAFNFIHVRTNPVDPEQIMVGGMKLGEVATVRIGK